ncbi:hypothetical protein CXB51_034310 [Gossypium anomalum]|uniref:Aminotransferase-like plant mobile domain-containing protein n=1 Tax=Gossypium anomalum TaxID=47600 RepID=A0A8J6CIY2_9ROSI|nr:hypothetical protein CXB51_034310 [Gossypium anomalum]
MAMPLIRLDDKHISDVQLQMRPETHTFHLLCGECTITLEDVALQLGLPMDGEVVTRIVGFGNWSATCEWNNKASHMGIVEELEDIRLLLDQRSKAEIEWMSYADLRIQEYIPSKFLTNRNIWHIKVALIIFTTVEMHESDRVMHQFRFRQSILSSPQDIEELHKIELRGRTDEDWEKFHAKYIYI